MNQFCDKPISVSEFTKSEFHEKIILPLVEEFGYPILFNGKEAWEKGFSAGRNLGVSYVHDAEKPIVIRWRQIPPLDVLQTLFHEIGHSALHSGSGLHVDENLKEVEAEWVSKLAFEFLGLEYRWWLRANPNVGYIQYHQDKYHTLCEQDKITPKIPRFDSIVEISGRIMHALNGLVG